MTESDQHEAAVTAPLPAGAVPEPPGLDTYELDQAVERIRDLEQQIATDAAMRQVYVAQAEAADRRVEQLAAQLAESEAQMRLVATALLDDGDGLIRVPGRVDAGPEPDSGLRRAMLRSVDGQSYQLVTYPVAGTLDEMLDRIGGLRDEPDIDAEIFPYWWDDVDSFNQAGIGSRGDAVLSAIPGAFTTEFEPLEALQRAAWLAVIASTVDPSIDLDFDLPWMIRKVSES